MNDHLWSRYSPSHWHYVKAPLRSADRLYMVYIVNQQLSAHVKGPLETTIWLETIEVQCSATVMETCKAETLTSRTVGKIRPQGPNSRLRKSPLLYICSPICKIVQVYAKRHKIMGEYWEKYTINDFIVQCSKTLDIGSFKWIVHTVSAVPALAWSHFTPGFWHWRAKLEVHYKPWTTEAHSSKGCPRFSKKVTNWLGQLYNKKKKANKKILTPEATSVAPVFTTPSIIHVML